MFSFLSNYYELLILMTVIFIKHIEVFKRNSLVLKNILASLMRSYLILNWLEIQVK